VRLAEDCDRLGIPIINPVAHHDHATKAEGARRIARAGLRTPRMVPIVDPAGFSRNLSHLEPPLLVRETAGHGGEIHLVKTRQDIARIPWQRYRAPLAVEFVDVRNSRDGLYRRYRYIVAGDVGVPQGVLFSRHWESRARLRVLPPGKEQEERAYTTSENPHHDLFVAARRELALDFVAFDYSYDRHGRIIVWEANLHPELSYPPNPERRRSRWMCERVYAAKLLLYLDRARYPVPAGLREFAEGQIASVPQAA
jgi:hypothetical protein